MLRKPIKLRLGSTQADRVSTVTCNKSIVLAAYAARNGLEKKHLANHLLSQMFCVGAEKLEGGVILQHRTRVFVVAGVSKWHERRLLGNFSLTTRVSVSPKLYSGKVFCSKELCVAFLLLAFFCLEDAGTNAESKPARFLAFSTSCRRPSISSSVVVEDATSSSS
ncbi:hypothetical protein JTE90_003729 [Oedothorax gibbosus]|uniref:Uncharacterized protein n=1 Tax=Oedothorax gibbosus TaxID=931172 RepID=A0AAV6VCY2_9ARAC|nr:hypothetical protein JTE90_003729 [Oedothorax gibbosus]